MWAITASNLLIMALLAMAAMALHRLFRVRLLLMRAAAAGAARAVVLGSREMAGQAAGELVLGLLMLRGMGAQTQAVVAVAAAG
jgi:hypothetical protein